MAKHPKLGKFHILAYYWDHWGSGPFAVGIDELKLMGFVITYTYLQFDAKYFFDKHKEFFKRIMKNENTSRRKNYLL